MECFDFYESSRSLRVYTSVEPPRTGNREALAFFLNSCTEPLETYIKKFIPRSPRHLSNSEFHIHSCLVAVLALTLALTLGLSGAFLGLYIHGRFHSGQSV